MGSGTPRATLGTGTGSGPWRERHGQSPAAKTTRQQNEAKTKQKHKTTSEEINKRKQTLGMRKQMPTSD
jgi:hypothetical protein